MLEGTCPWRGSPWLQGRRTVLCLAAGRGHRCERVPGHRGVPSTTAEGPPGLPESGWDPPRACSPAAAPPTVQPPPPPPAALWPLLLFTAAHRKRRLSHRLSSPPAAAKTPPDSPTSRSPACPKGDHHWLPLCPRDVASRGTDSAGPSLLQETPSLHAIQGNRLPPASVSSLALPFPLNLLALEGSRVLPSVLVSGHEHSR